MNQAPIFMTLWQQIVARAQDACNRPGWDWRIKRWKFIGRAALTPGLTRRWFKLLGRAELASLVSQRPRLFGKLQRPYLFRSLGPRRRLQALEAHYTFAIAHLSQPALSAIAAPAGLKLCEMSSSDSGPLSLRLLYTDAFEKEGELTLGIFAQEPARLVTAATFSIIPTADGAREIFIGGLQAGNKADQRDLIRDVTKEIFGMRPKAFALWSIQTLAAVWHLPRIRAVGDDQHVYRHFQERKDISASYDDFWQESEGIADGRGFFVLPPRFTPRPPEDIKPNKRRLYQRRYELLESLAGQMRATLEHICPDVPPGG